MVMALPPGFNRADRFTLIRTADGIRILSGQYGGYLHGDSWRLSTPIVSATKDGDLYKARTKSGSDYAFYSGAYGMSGLMASVFESYSSQAKADNIQFEAIPEGEFEKVLAGFA